MKRNLLALLAVGIFCTGMVASSLMAQAPAQPGAAATTPQQPQLPPRGSVVVVDMILLMKMHRNYYNQTMQLEAQFKKDNAVFETRQKEWQTQTNVLLNTMTVGSADHTQKTEQLRKDKSLLEADYTTFKEKIDKADFQNQYNAYMEIKYFIYQIASQQGYPIVLSYKQPGTFIDPAKLQDPSKKSLQDMKMEFDLGASQEVMWVNNGYDITPWVQAYLDQKYQTLPAVVLDSNRMPVVNVANRNGAVQQ